MISNLSTKNKILIILTIALLLIGIPLTILQVKKQQETRQRASQDNGVSVLVSPSSLTKNINEDFDVDIHLLNSNLKEISAVDINYAGYNQSMFESVVFQPSQEFQGIINKNQRYVGISPSESHINGADIRLGTLKFVKSKDAGTVYLNLYSIRINVSGIRDAIVLENIGGQYTITNAKPSPAAGNASPTPASPTLIPTPTGISIPTAIPTETPIQLPTATPIPASVSSDASYNACVATCNRNAAADPETFNAPTCIQGCNTQYGK